MAFQEFYKAPEKAEKKQNVFEKGSVLEAEFSRKIEKMEQFLNSIESPEIEEYSKELDAIRQAFKKEQKENVQAAVQGILESANDLVAAKVKEVMGLSLDHRMTEGEQRTLEDKFV